MMKAVTAGIALALLAASSYGLIPNLAKAAYHAGVPVVDIAFVRTCVIAPVLAVLAIVRREQLTIPRILLPAFLIQVFATATLSLGYTAAVQFIPVTLAVIIFFTCPVIVLLVAPLIEKRRPGASRLGIALIAFCGLALAIAPNVQKLDWRGLVLAGIGAAAYALQFFSGRSLSQHMAPASIGALVHLGVWPFMLGAALWYDSGTIAVLSTAEGIASRGFALVLLLSAIYTAAYFLHMQALKRAPASTVAPFFNFEPIVTTAVAALVFGERLFANQYVGGVLVLSALLCAAMIERKGALRPQEA